MAEPLNLVAHLKIESVDASAVGEALSSELRNLTPTTGEAAGAGGIESIDFGDVTPRDDLFAMLEDMLPELSAGLAEIAPEISVIAALLFIIKDLFGAFAKGFEGVTKMLGMIFDMIARMVTPFANLLIPLLLPFLYISSLVARTLNLILMPLYTGLMKVFSTSGTTMTTALTEIMSGDLLGGLKTIFDEIAPKLAALGTTIADTLQPLFKMLAGWITSFLTMDLSGIRKTLEDLLGTQLGDALYGFISLLYKGISAISGFIAQLVGKDTFNSIFGTKAIPDAFDNIKNTNEAFAGGASVAEKLQEIISALATLGEAAISFASLLTSGDWKDALRLAVGVFLEGMTLAGLGVLEGIKIVVDTLITSGGETGANIVKAGAQFGEALLKFTYDNLPNVKSGIDYMVAMLRWFGDTLAGVASTFADLPALFANMAFQNMLGQMGNPKQVMEDFIKKHGFGTNILPTFKQATAIDTFTAPLADSIQSSITAMDNFANIPSDDTKSLVTQANETIDSLKGNLVIMSDTIMNNVILPKPIEYFSQQIASLSDATKTWSEKMSAYDPVAAFQAGVENLIEATRTSTAGTANASTGGDKLLWAAPGYTGYQSDFISRPGQGAASFSPQDTIIGVKDTSKLGAGKSVQITNHYYIQGYNDQSLIDKIKTTIEQHDANLSRSGYYNKGY